MFGGLAFLIDGNMSVAASGQGGLLVRVPPDDTDKLLARRSRQPMVMAGREARGWIARRRRRAARPNASCRAGSPGASATREPCHRSDRARLATEAGTRVHMSVDSHEREQRVRRLLEVAGTTYAAEASIDQPTSR